jgi:hypothetical protein
MKLLLALAYAALIALWQIADQLLHGGFETRNLVANLCIAAAVCALTALRPRTRASERADPQAARAAAIFTGIVLGLVLAAAGTLAELALRTRADDSTTTLLAALVVHWSAACIVATTHAGLGALRAGARDAAPIAA